MIAIALCISGVSAAENHTSSTDTTITETIDSHTTQHIETNENVPNTTYSQKSKIYVSAKGNDSNTGTEDSPKLTIQNAVDNVKDDGVIIIGPGTYNESEINIGKNIKIIGNSTKNTILNSQKKHALTISGNVLLKTFTIQNAKHKSNGGAIINNGTLVLEGLKISTSSSSKNGGAIYNNGILNATKTSFTSNNANYGGAIYNNNTLILNKCTFSSNKANNMASGIYTNNCMKIKNCNFTNNQKTAIYVDQNRNTQDIDSSIFKSNNATSGGAIFNRNSMITISNSKFQENYANISGGAIYSTGIINSTKNEFNYNNAPNGGAILNKKQLFISDNRFNNNNAEKNGGSIHNNYRITAYNTQFNNNSAQYGGAIYSKTNTSILVSIYDSSLENNSATTGGALYILNQTRLFTKNTTFDSNTNNAIYIKTTSPSTVLNSTFTRNTATYGGAIRNVLSQVIVKKCYSQYNKASYGNMIHNYNGHINCTYNVILDNGRDIHNRGEADINYNWWGSNNISGKRVFNALNNNTLYMTITHRYTRLFNGTINTTISCYNTFDGENIHSLPNRNALPMINMQITVAGCGVSRTLNVTNRGYCQISDKFNEEGRVVFTINTSSDILRDTLEIKAPGKSNVFINDLQAFTTDNVTVKVNVTDELNNSITDGKIDLYLNGKKKVSKKVSATNTFTIARQKVGVYDLKAIFTSDNYMTSNKTVKLTVNPKSDYTIKIVDNPRIFSRAKTKLSSTVRNKSKATINKGLVKFYLNNKYVGSSNTKNNLSSIKIVLPVGEGNYPLKAAYYLNDKFIGADTKIVHVKKLGNQVKQNTFITIAGDLISNTKINSTKKDVYFAMDRTTASYDYSPNDMKIMNNIAYNLKANGFNVKTIRNGPGETYNTAKYMYNHNVKNSICFILCNGVDANVIREYLKGYDNMLTKVRNRGNDIVMGWFYGAGDIYNEDGEYYYWLQKAWDDNYSSWGGMKNPRKTAERDGIKIIYEKNDMTGGQIASSFVKLYKGIVTENVSKNSTISVKTNIYRTNNANITGGNIVYTLNGKIIKNVTVHGNSYTFKFVVPDVGGTYNLKATYYQNNKVICKTEDRYIRIV